MFCVRAKNLGLQNKSDACPLPVVVSRMTEASCSIRPPWNSGSSAERGMATSRPPPAREVPTGTNRPGRARVLCLPREGAVRGLLASARCLPRDPALLAPWPRAACLASVGSVPRDCLPHAPREPGLHPCPRACAARSMPRAGELCLFLAMARAACPARWCRALACLLRAMVPRAGALAARDAAARWFACCARCCRALASLLRAMVPRSGLLAPGDGAARWFACCARWGRALACLLRSWYRALACLLRAMVLRAIALSLRDGAARWLACCACWCRARARLLLAMVQPAG